jgi:hypothetical protein
LDELKDQMALNFQHDEQMDLFLARRIAALAGIRADDFLKQITTQ